MKIQLEADKILEKMAETFRERNKLYGSNYNAVGEVLIALFPEGVTLKTKEDFIRWHFMDWKVGKLTRFARTKMTHTDSLHDDAVYTAMLEDFILRTAKGGDEYEE